MSEHTFSLTHITETTLGTAKLKVISVVATRAVPMFAPTVDVNGNLVWTYSTNKSGEIQVIVSMAEKDTILELNKIVVAQDISPYAVPPLPFASRDESTSPASTVVAPRCRVLGHPAEGYTIVENKGETTLAYSLSGNITITLGGFRPD